MGTVVVVVVVVVDVEVDVVAGGSEVRATFAVVVEDDPAASSEVAEVHDAATSTTATSKKGFTIAPSY